MKEYTHHPYAGLFPFMPAAEIVALAASIKERGLQQPIVTYEGKILDGRHRYEACQQAGVRPTFEEYTGHDPLGYVIAANMHRRHLTTSQRAMIAAEVAKLPQGRREKEKEAKVIDSITNKPANLPVCQADAAEKLQVSERTVRTAVKVQDESPKLAAQVKAGEITVNAAVKKLAEKKAEPKKEVDCTGYPIPEDLVELWNRRNEVLEVMRSVAALKNALLESQKAEDVLWCLLPFGDVTSRLQYIHMELKAAQVYAVCTTCQGRARSRCTFCKGRGFISQFAWKTMVPNEIKVLRAKACKK